MTLRSLWRSFAVIGVALATFGIAPGAMAGVIGSGTLDITNGWFYYNSGGVGTFTPVTGGSSMYYYELATGDFAYSNTLPSNSANYYYNATANVEVNGGASSGQSFSRSIDLGYTTFNAIISQPGAAAAYALFGTLAGSTTGSGTILAGYGIGGPYDFNWAYNIASTTSTSASGSFDLWSTTNYSGNANLGGLVLPNEATFTAKMALVAVPEPGTLGLLSLGLLIIGWLGRRKSA